MQLGKNEVEYINLEVYQNHILEQYKAYITRLSAEQSRNEITNSFFLTINTAMVTALVLVSRGSSDIHFSGIEFVTISAVVICFFWWLTLHSIARWHVAQLETLQEIEDYLPLKLFTTEWYEKLSLSRTYFKIRTIKQLIPWIFKVVHIGTYLMLSTSASS